MVEVGSLKHATEQHLAERSAFVIQCYARRYLGRCRDVRVSKEWRGFNLRQKQNFEDMMQEMMREMMGGDDIMDLVAGMSPAGPFRCGSTTCKVIAVATAASKALPPRSRMPMPTADAIQWVEVTTPNVPRISGLVVKLIVCLSVRGGRVHRAAHPPAG